jgi:predicted DNA-binding transcriptional regulator YafY
VKPGRWDERQHAEHLRIVDIRTREGRSAADIAAELRCSPRTVERYRNELRRQVAA